VLRAESGAGALDVLRESTLRGAPTALMLVDQGMPGMSGVEFMEPAIGERRWLGGAPLS
jgi:thioredoxin reductase (NADPH)